MKRIIKNLYTLDGGVAQERVNELRTLLGLGTTDNSAEFVEHVLATAANDFLVASGSGVFVKKTLAQTRAILYASATPTVIDIPATSTRAIRVGTKGISYAASGAIAITSIGGTLDAEPANNYLVGVFSKVTTSETTTSTDDLGSAWFRTQVNNGVTIGAAYSLYGAKSQLRIYSAASAGAVSISNWCAAGQMAVLEVSGASTTFASGCVAAALYTNVSLALTTTVVASGAIVAGVVINSASTLTAATGGYYGLQIQDYSGGNLDFQSGINIASSCCTTGISIGTCTTGIDIAATCTNAINIAAAANVTNLFKFNAAAGCILNVDVNPKDVPSTGGLGADACIRVLIGTADYFIPLFAIELS